jgi:hypothetical protein
MEWLVRPDTDGVPLDTPNWLRLKAAEFVQLMARTRHPAMRRELKLLAAKFLARARDLEAVADGTDGARAVDLAKPGDQEERVAAGDDVRTMDRQRGAT